MKKTVELITNVIGVFAALLGLAGYVLVLGAVILWIRLHEAGLPTAVPISIAPKGELIAIGAQAVAVWALLVIVLLAVGAWIVTGDPVRRRFGYVEAGLALTITLSMLPALETGETLLLLIPAFAALIVVASALIFWPSGEEIVALLLPIATGAALAIALSKMSNIDHAATVAGAIFVFGALAFLTPSLQRWRTHQEANPVAVAALKTTDQKGLGTDESLVAALEQNGPRRKPPAILWIERAAVALVVLIAVGAIAVASQIKRSENFNEALLSLSNGDCLMGTYVTRNSEQIVLAEPVEEGHDPDPLARVTTIPTEEVLALHIYGENEEGSKLLADPKCATNSAAALVHPAESKAESKGKDESEEVGR